MNSMMKHGSRVSWPIRLVWLEAALAAAAFAALVTVVLSVAPQLGVEPDDGAYRASIVAITEGDFLTLSATQAEALARTLGDNPAAPPNQWVELPGGRVISEKDPGYPFLAAPFQALGIIRWAPLFLRRRAGLALWPLEQNAWRLARAFRRCGGGGPVLLVRGGAAVRLARLHADVHGRVADRGRIGNPAVGIASDRSQLPAAYLGRARGVRGDRDRDVYPNSTSTYVILGCAVVAVTVTWWLRAANLTRRTLYWWLTSVAVFGIGTGVFNDLVYGSPLSSGYRLATRTLIRVRFRRNRRHRGESAVHARTPDAGYADAGARAGGAHMDHRPGGNAEAGRRRVQRSPGSVGWRGPSCLMDGGLGPLLRVLLDERSVREHLANSQVLCPCDGRDLLARRLAAHQAHQPRRLARDPHLSRGNRDDVRTGHMVLSHNGRGNQRHRLAGAA